MRILIIGNIFRLPLPLYDICLYGGILLTLASTGVFLFGAIKNKETHRPSVWFIVLAAGMLISSPSYWP